MDLSLSEEQGNDRRHGAGVSSGKKSCRWSSTSTPDADELEPEDRARLIEKTKSMGLYGLGHPRGIRGAPEIDLMTRTLMGHGDESAPRRVVMPPCLRCVRRCGDWAQTFRGDGSAEREVSLSHLAG